MSADYIAYRDGVWTPEIIIGGETRRLRFEVEEGDKIYFDAACNGRLDLEDDTCVCEASLIESYTEGDDE